LRRERGKRGLQKLPAKKAFYPTPQKKGSLRCGDGEPPRPNKIPWKRGPPGRSLNGGAAGRSTATKKTKDPEKKKKKKDLAPKDSGTKNHRKRYRMSVCHAEKGFKPKAVDKQGLSFSGGGKKETQTKKALVKTRGTERDTRAGKGFTEAQKEKKKCLGRNRRGGCCITGGTAGAKDHGPNNRNVTDPYNCGKGSNGQDPFVERESLLVGRSFAM